MDYGGGWMKLDKVIGKGAQATVYRSEQYAIKVFDESCDKTGVFYEALVNSIIENTDLPVPKNYEVLNINNQMAIKMDYIKGISLFECISKNPENIMVYMESMVKLHKKIHTKKATVPLSLKGRLRNKIVDNKELSVTAKEKILDILTRLPDGNELCHGDFHGYNIMVDDDKYWIIDWVDSTYGCAEGDVCRTYMMYMLHAPEQGEIYLDLYCKDTGTEKEKILEWLPVIATARLSENIPNEKEKIIEWISKYIE